MRVLSRWSRSLLAVALLCIPARQALAQFDAPPPAPVPSAADTSRNAPGASLTINLMTMGVGPEVWENFGHSAIWIHENATGQDAVYNWGLFDFRAPHFVWHFIQGRMVYAMGADDIASTLAQYRQMDRSVWVQELDLTPAEKLWILQYVNWNSMPEHRTYLYNYFTDNCATRVRDIIDRAIGGRLRAATANVATPVSYRSESLRLTQGDILMSTGIDIGLGFPADSQLTKWSEMFLPMRIRDAVRTVRVPDGTGGTKPLVKSERELYASGNNIEPTSGPNWTPWYLLLGVVIGVVFLLCHRSGARAARIVGVVVFAVYCLLAGILGVLLTFLWLGTNHSFAYYNENLFVFNPLWLVLFVLAFLSGMRAVEWRRNLLAIVAALAVIGLLIHVARGIAQGNIPLLALTLPPTLAFLLGYWRAPRRV